uniref:2,3-bisphosphoglycerate 3-phosphatase n=1 Tax=Poecilia mexicana TaxID=48701 RepID=A0A3B3YJD3_9TELE
MLHIGTHGFLWLAALSLIQTVEFCSSAEIPDVPSIATYFGTKTRYEEVKPNLLRDPLTVNTSVLRPPPDSAQGYNHEVDDELMRFFERCRGYVEGVENNHTALLEVEKFKHGEEMQAVRRRLAEKLGLSLHLLTPDLVEAAFFICSYELSIKSIHSPWCFLFDESDAKVLEYSFDLKQFWKRSHGHLISSLSSCPLFHHIFRTLDKAGRPRRSTEAGPEPASVLVGHAETLIPLISLLGLYKDQTLPTASNYHSQHGRSFRTSRIIPYAANLLFVLYDCQRGPRLQLLINETPLRFPNFQTEDAPLYRDVRAAYRYLLDGCDFNTECERKPEGRGPNTEL